MMMTAARAHTNHRLPLLMGRADARPGTELGRMPTTSHYIADTAFYIRVYLKNLFLLYQLVILLDLLVPHQTNRVFVSKKTPG